MSDPQGDFEEVFNDCYEPVVRYVARRVAPDAVQDVVSDTFLVAWRRHAELRGEPLPWLLGIARRVASTQRRGHARREALQQRLRAERPPVDPTGELAMSDPRLEQALPLSGRARPRSAHARRLGRARPSHGRTGDGLLDGLAHRAPAPRAATARALARRGRARAARARRADGIAAVSVHAHNDPIARLAAADPARSLRIDPREREKLWQRVLAGEGNRAPLYPEARRALRPRTRNLVLVVLLALAVLGALAAGGVIEIGSRAKLPYSTFGNASEGTGALMAGTVHRLPIAAPDPAGGPPWGMRELSTSRGTGCLQIGRIVDGKLGALGQDHAFGDDGRFHELPVAADSDGCELLDGEHRLFANVTADARPASAWIGTGGRLGGCVPPTAGPYEKGLRLTPEERAHGARPAPLCRQSDLRNIYYGLLGPRAESITYALEGQRHTLATIGPEGAYMFVTRASPKQLLNFANAGTADVVPVDGPVKEIHYRDGATCHLTAKSWIGGRNACTPSLPEPYGYAPVGRVASAAEAAASVHAHIGRERLGHTAILVTFRVPIAITDGRRAYSIRWREPTMPPGAYGGTRIDHDVAAGTIVTEPIGGLGARGHTVAGSVSLQEAIGAGGLEGPGSVSVPVGSFSIRVPAG